MVVACFTAAGAVFGTVPGELIALFREKVHLKTKNLFFLLFYLYRIGAQIAAVPALAGCNTAFGVCEAACVAALVAPTL